MKGVLRRTVLAMCGRFDSLRVLSALREHGTLGALVEAQRRAGASEPAIERLEHFATELHRLGVLRGPVTSSPVLATSRA